MFYEDQIIRTSYFIFLSYPIVSSSFIIFSRYNNLDILKNDMVAFFFMLILLCLINLIFPIYDDYWFPYKSYTFFELIKFYYFSGTNNIFIFLFFFILLIFYRKKFITFTIFILLFTISTTFQMLIISILFLLIFLIDLRKFLKFSFLIIIFSFLLLPIINLETNLLVKLIGNFDANLYTRISKSTTH